MVSLVYLFLACALITTNATEFNVTSTSTEYLDNRLKEVKVEIAKAHNEEFAPDRPSIYNVQWERLWSKSLSTKHAMTVNMFEKTFVLDGNRIMSIAIEIDPKNKNSTLQEISIIRQEQTVKFIRSTVWKNSLYFLVCQESGPCSLYTGKVTKTQNLVLTYRHTIRNKGTFEDAAFFTQNNQLYLVVAENTGRYTMPSVIYRWMGTYMDIIEEVMTTGAVSVTTFKHKHSEIIIFAQNVNGNPRIGSGVYRFKNDVLENIQFLATDAPHSIQHYTHMDSTFVLVVNENKPSDVFWWDGKELLKWMEIVDIKSPSIVRIIHTMEDTLFFVAYMNTVQVYRLLNAAYTKLDPFVLEDRIRITDMDIWMNDKIITLILVTLGPNNLHHIEPLDLVIKKITNGLLNQKIESAFKCLQNLADRLKERMPNVEEAKSLWPRLLSSSENINITESIKFTDMILKSGSVKNTDVSITEEIMRPSEISNNLQTLKSTADKILLESQKTVQKNKPNLFTGNMVIRSNASFNELHVDSLETNFFNNENIDFKQIISRSKKQEFSEPLKGKHVIINTLLMESHCGIPFQYWSQKDKPWRMSLNKSDRNMDFINNTILIKSNLNVNELRVHKLNNVQLEEFFDDLFIPGYRQHITGNIIFKKALKVVNLTTETLNGIPSNHLITKTTDQQLQNVYIKSLGVQNLVADTINGVPVSQAAMTTKKNHIKGEVIMSDLEITDELIYDSNGNFSEIRPTFIYDDVTILGDLIIKNLDVKSKNSIILRGKEINIEKLFNTSWTKSSNQVITNSITLKKGVTIDNLQTKYLNGLTEDDFLYTTMKEIPEDFGKLHFHSFETGGSLFSDKSKPSYYLFAGESLIVNAKLHIENLTVRHLYTKFFNKFPVDSLGKNIVTEFPHDVVFETVLVNDFVRADQMSISSLNDVHMTEFFKKAIYVDGNYNMETVNVQQFNVFNFNVENINGKLLNDIFAIFTQSHLALQNLSIDGNLEVEGNLKVNYINDNETEDYLSMIVSTDHVIADGPYIIENLTVHGDMYINFLHGEKLENLLLNKFSKTQEQTIPGSFSFYNVKSNNLTVNFINDCDMSKLLFIDQPLIFNRNVTFNDLFIKQDVFTTVLNNNNITTLYDNLLFVPSTNIHNLTINGRLSWETLASNENSLSYLYENAVTRNTNQIILQDTIFVNNVSAVDVQSDENLANLSIVDIVSDSVLSKDNTSVEISGRKVFNNDLSMENLNVINNTYVLSINGADIRYINSSIVKKFNQETITGPTIFKGDVTIGRLFVKSGNVHGRPIRGLVQNTDILPNGIVFQNLEIKGRLISKMLDGIDFQDFMANRVSLSGDHQVFGNFQFNKRIVVTDNAVIDTINNITMSDLIVNGKKEEQIIYGSKLFSNNLIVHGHMYAPLINNMDIVNEYRNGIVNDDSVDIYGDLVFQSNVDIRPGTNVSGYLNGMSLHRVNDEFGSEVQGSLVELKRNEHLIENTITKFVNVSQSLSNIFFYLENEEKLELRVPNVERIIVKYIESITKLNMYGNELGRYCGLPDSCPCPTQYSAEILDKDCKIWKNNDSEILYNFYEPNGAFGINIFTNSISSSRECTGNDPNKEFIKIAWMTPKADYKEQLGEGLGVNFQTTLLRQGFVKDVEVLTYNENIYIILAIYYDATQSSHQLESPIYKLDWTTRKITLAQNISTNGAWALETFKIPGQGPYLLVGCSQYQAESQLYRINPISSKFELVRTFASASRHVKSLVQQTDYFILLDDPVTNSVHIFQYNFVFNNFYFYQNLYFDSRITSIEVFYAGEFKSSDSYIIITTEEGKLHIYEYMFFGKFQLKTVHWVNDIQTAVPFYFKGHRYVFVGTKQYSSVFKIVGQGPD
ncbi:uncharacterized protein LOC107273586 [Cephus cinctus]|uniref:Uncharacterized protein LOC107273586 n=1 Tax=Cephus cinctus TaxID=211228 RepID=A0AAJ7CCI3_CEPCN|nr:uncharacterized protein LOC107273586 [Cephus cinctus]